jgi:hypothetical protein
MPMTRTHNTVASLMVGMVCLAAPCVSRAASPVPLAGAITGTVNNSTGVPQMGATVLLFSRQDRLLGKMLTDDRGEFRFAGLFPDVYSLRVTLAAFVPALRNNIVVQPGMRSVFNVNLNSLFSTIQLAYPPIENGNIMTDDWKWVLRSASSTRPILRFRDQDKTVRGTTQGDERTAVFQDTRGMLKLSAGDGPQSTGTGSQADLGTAFALATSLFGNNMLQVSGNFGYGSQTGAPAAAFRTSYSRNVAGMSPAVTLTMRQIMLPGRATALVGGQDSAMPMLKTMSAGFEDRTQVSDNVRVQYGITSDSISFLDHVNYLSPYAQLQYDLGDGSMLQLSYSSGNARPDLGGTATQDELQRDLSTLGLFPLVSLKDERTKIQRGTEYELAYLQKIGSRTYQVSAYGETVSNAALTMVGPTGMFSSGDILPDLFAGSSTFNIGNYQSIGYTASATQNLGQHFSATVMYGSTGALTVNGNGELVSNDPDELRSMIRAGRRRAATMRVAATLPKSGTHLIASYMFTNGDGTVAMIGNSYSTQAIRPMPGFNVFVRQTIPGFSRRVEATAELRNLLAQGYLPFVAAGGQQLLLMQTPRSVRGGLSFIF